MIFSETKLKGVFIIEIEKKEDERGFFARTFDKAVFEKHGLNPNFVQCSISFNRKKGTIRGMHYQDPYTENKLIMCTRGSIFDVIIDIRSYSKTFKQWISIEISEDNYKMIYIPEGFAHGFQTLEDNTEVFYQITQVYMPEYAKGIRWNDKTFGIPWPLEPTIISKKDSSYESFEYNNI